MKMKFAMIAACAAGLTMGAFSAHAACSSLSSDVVSLGERAARYYSERSLIKAIDDERNRFGTVGLVSARVTKSMDCKPYPNLIGADEWRCVGAAKICSK
jgi:hypothetical protein